MIPQRFGSGFVAAVSLGVAQLGTGLLLRIVSQPGIE
jgi:hypothetical protein